MNISKKLGLGLLSIAALVILPGCGKKQLRKPIKTLKPLTAQKADFKETQQDITLSTKLFSTDEYKKLLRKKKISRSNRRIKAIQISVTNDTKNNWMLSSRGIGLDQIPYKKMERQVIRYASWSGLRAALPVALTGGLLIGTGAAAIYGGLMLSMLFTEILEIGITGGQIVAGGSAAIVAGAGVSAASPVVAIKKATSTAEFNAQNKMRLQKMMLVNPMIVKPGKTKSRIIFVNKRNYEPEFEVELINAENKKDQLYFSVDLEPQYM